MVKMKSSIGSQYPIEGETMGFSSKMRFNFKHGKRLAIFNLRALLLFGNR